jgi:hypothetical protein
LYGKPDHRRTTGKKVTLDVKEIVVQQVHTFEKPPNPGLPGSSRPMKRH